MTDFSVIPRRDKIAESVLNYKVLDMYGYVGIIENGIRVG
jgi:hypothetical protein